MSDVNLATKYSPENYPTALNNLVKRYQQGDGSPINYTEVAFGDISESKASVALKHLSQANIIENTKQANYQVPEEVVNWQRKMGQIQEEAKSEVRKRLQEYNVYSETEFVLKEEGSQNIDELVEQVGGLVGIDEDEVGDMKRTINIFAELGFLRIDTEGTVELIDHSLGETKEENGEVDSESSEATIIQESDNSNNESATSTRTEGEIVEVPTTQRLTVDLDMSLDATELETEEFRKKLEIVEDVLGYDGE